MAAIILVVKLGIGTSVISKNKTIYYLLEPPSSFDPLEADRASNLPVARMLYLTPLEVSVTNELTSTVLEKFGYDPVSQIINFRVRNDLKFSDGSPLETGDVVLAITRMLLSKPDFPVIKMIVGLSDWLKVEHPLLSRPKGIEVEGQDIRIVLQRHVRNPLFRFTLELFSIIPGKCIDLLTTKLTCEMPPASGYYEVKDFTKNTFHFKKRLNPTVHQIEIPINLTLKYINNQQLKDVSFSSEPDSVLYSFEYLFVNSKMNLSFPELKYRYLPFSYFAGIVINPNVKPFDDVGCRRAFAQAFRQNMKKVSNGTLRFSPSIFTTILPGFLNDSVFEEINLNSKCAVKSNMNLKFYDPKDNSLLSEALNLTYQEFGIASVRIVGADSLASAEKQFIAGTIPVLTFGSGFWSLDPVGDLQMMFTPNLHPRLQFTANDSELRLMINSLDSSLTDNDLKLKMERINKHLYDSGLLNVFLHTRKFYASVNVDQLRELPQQISAPSPWQIFR